MRKWRASKKLKVENQAKVHQQQEREFIKENGNDNKAKQGEINEELRNQFVSDNKISEKDDLNSLAI